MKRYFTSLLSLLAVVSVLLLPGTAEAVPAFARQTGQNCVACHAGGQFPELTPYGRIFKLTGYTIGERTLPLSMMGVLSANKVKVNDPAAGKTQDGSLVFSTGSLFIAGKITDNIGGFAQITYDNYNTDDPSGAKPDNGWFGHSHSDNVDIRYTDRFINDKSDLIVGLSLHNNPTVQDVFNSAPAWGYGVVPGSTGAGSGTMTKLEDGLGQQVAGVGAYAYWNRTVYAELSGYKTGNGVFSFMTQGNGGQVYLKGTNPYLRLALTKEWGAHNAMIGLTHLDVRQYQADITSPTDHFRDTGIDAQYQYILDPYTVTATVTRIHETIDPGSAGLLSDTVNALKAKASFVYQAKYGATLSYFDYSNTGNNSTAITPVDMQHGSRGWTPEIFWTPVQYVRLGLQYTAFNRVNGLSSNTDGAGRNAKDDNTLFFYVWGAY